ncbi:MULTISPECIES: helix-turn-helix domain-containing protein [Neorhizobium]|jgi:transcriptional regulator with XRE-family HTH domain|uniref:helix-turn-helix domain-containing protein n=2 Tax=Rhizobium/Agrobacterium group TaxID=227290 RepID=UPI00155E1EC8|nr:MULTISPECIES: helix-turn-helix transcriptional regulator [Neorhizobium]
MLTVSQLRAARAMTGMTVEELAAASGLSKSAIEEAEASQVFANAGVTDRLRSIFESKGVLFLGAGQDDAGAGPGLRLRQQFHDEGIRPQNLNAANDD